MLANTGLYSVVQEEDAEDQLESSEHFTAYYLLFPSFGNSLKKCSLV